ncbi:hypothetical protein H2199_003335 [Coniosporium tulheliwenetii]|uniref:Uncharacterized protein n=1 Tax=Coniosporium tulheliwenetii TaxID=3383036 RepID=A0ACC2ZCK2_9PEZI|nr:hypothetical protein H2199_003335 [Cladosporium sp. JES 115]
MPLCFGLFEEDEWEVWLKEEFGDEETQAERMLQLSASFIFQGVRDRPFSNGLIHLLAVLGIDEEMDRLRTAKNYSYMLAGVVYCVRVLGVEALLPYWNNRKAKGSEATTPQNSKYCLVLVAALAARGGDIGCSNLYTGNEYLQWKDIELELKGRSTIDGYFTLKAEKGKKHELNNHKVVRLEALPNPGDNIVDPVKLLFVLADPVMGVA